MVAAEDLCVGRVRVGVLRPFQEPVPVLVRVRLRQQGQDPGLPRAAGRGAGHADFRLRARLWQNVALSRAYPGPSHPEPHRPSRNRPRSPPGRPALTTHEFRGDTTDVAVKIRLKRLGKIRVPQYRIVVVDSRKKRDGRVIEEIGKYHPKEDPSYIDVVSDRAQYWLGVGAQPSTPSQRSSRSPATGRPSRACPAPRAPSRSPSRSATRPRSSTRPSRTPPRSPRATR